jgi:hypothetical protein
MSAPCLTVATVLEWAAAHRWRTGRWPHTRSGPVAGVPGQPWDPSTGRRPRPRRLCGCWGRGGAGATRPRPLRWTRGKSCAGPTPTSVEPLVDENAAQAGHPIGGPERIVDADLLPTRGQHDPPGGLGFRRLPRLRVQDPFHHRLRVFRPGREVSDALLDDDRDLAAEFLVKPAGSVGFSPGRTAPAGRSYLHRTTSLGACIRLLIALTESAPESRSGSLQDDD